MRSRASPRGEAEAPEQDVGASPAACAISATAAATSSDSSTSSRAPSTDASWRSAPSERSCSSESDCGRRPDPEQVEFRAEPLRGAPCPADEALGARIRLDQRQQPLPDRLRRIGGRLSSREPTCSVVSRFWPTSSATWRSATSRSADRFSIRKKLLSAGVDSLGRVDLARAQALEQRLGGEVNHHDLVGPARGRRRGSSPAPVTPVSSATRSLSDSRCWTLSVESTSIPAASTSSTSS